MRHALAAIRSYRRVVGGFADFERRFRYVHRERVGLLARAANADRPACERPAGSITSLECYHLSLSTLWQFGFDDVGEEFLAVGASPGWRPCEEVEDGLPDGRHARLWRRSPNFFSVPLL